MNLLCGWMETQFKHSDKIKQSFIEKDVYYSLNQTLFERPRALLAASHPNNVCDEFLFQINSNKQEMYIKHKITLH